jgi:hypothetical protein
MSNLEMFLKIYLSYNVEWLRLCLDQCTSAIWDLAIIIRWLRFISVFYQYQTDLVNRSLIIRLIETSEPVPKWSGHYKA